MSRHNHKLNLFAVATAAALLPTLTMASSHREAPLIGGTPRLDGTDFYMFRSYEANRSAFVTMIANYVPLQDPYGGPNFFPLDTNAVYDIHVDNTGSAKPNMTFRFRAQKVNKGLSVTVGGKSVPVALTELGPIPNSNTPPATQNVVETYTMSLVTYANGQATETPVINADTGGTVFPKPVDNVGNKTIPDYPGYAAKFIYNIRIPGCATAGRVFVGQRREGFFVSLGETFDLINNANPVGEQFANSRLNDLADKNITSLAVEAPIACLTAGNDPVIGAWTTSSSVTKNGAGITTLLQVSRLGNPLVNEVVIGLADKDKFNASQPINDPQFLTYVTNPTLPAIIELLFGTPAPTLFPRSDLVAVFLTGLSGVNAPANLTAPGEEMRLNTSTAPLPKGGQNRLGVIGGDGAGYPNGRRPGDDVVDISLRVVMGRLLVNPPLFGTPGQAVSGNLDFTDGAYGDSTFFDASFPYLRNPLPASPQSALNPTPR